MMETCTKGKDELQYEQIAKEHNDGGPNPFIHEHLATLYFITKAFDCMEVLEIGTGAGASTTAFAEAGALITTIDIEPCEFARSFCEPFGSRINFIQEDSTTFEIEYNYDIVFIDGSHTWQQVRHDLEKFSPHATKFLILHDITNPAHTGVGRAIREFLRNNKDWDYYQWFNCNGLAVLKRRK